MAEPVMEGEEDGERRFRMSAERLERQRSSKNQYGISIKKKFGRL